MQLRVIKMQPVRALPLELRQKIRRFLDDEDFTGILMGVQSMILDHLGDEEAEAANAMINTFVDEIWTLAEPDGRQDAREFCDAYKRLKGEWPTPEYGPLLLEWLDAGRPATIDEFITTGGRPSQDDFFGAYIHVSGRLSPTAEFCRLVAEWKAAGRPDNMEEFITAGIAAVA